MFSTSPDPINQSPGAVDYDLVRIPAAAASSILATHGGGPELFIAGRGKENSLDPGHSFPFARVRFDQALLDKLRSGIAFCRENHASRTEFICVDDGRIGFARAPVAAANSAGETPELLWKLHCTQSTFWFAAEESGQLAFVSTDLRANALLKRIDPCQAGEYHDYSLRSELDAETQQRKQRAECYAARLPALTQFVGPYLLLSENDTEDFVYAVSKQVPEVAAAVLAEAMKHRVHESLGSANGLSNPLDEQPAGNLAPRRRRMGI
jgi:hypothetical protein